jgi:hypothetical protein
MRQTCTHSSLAGSLVTPRRSNPQSYTRPTAVEWAKTQGTWLSRAAVMHVIGRKAAHSFIHSVKLHLQQNLI